MSFRNTLSQIWSNIQSRLFPELEFHIGELSEEHKKIIAILELVRIEEFCQCTRFFWGRPPKERIFMARAFIAKAVLKIPYTKQLIYQLKLDKRLRMICGWEAYSIMPSESKFSRAFKEFSETNLPDRVHQALIEGIYKDEIIGHLSIDSLPITAREKFLKKEGSYKERKKLANERHAKEKKEGIPNRRQKQMEQSLEVMLKELPSQCDIGRKTNAQGHSYSWKGYKIHAAVDDYCIPIAVILTSASLNDCEAAIPLMTKSHRVANNFYDLMDSAYDVTEVKEYSRKLNHVPIIDEHARSKTQKEEKEKERLAKKNLRFKTAEDSRYQERFPKERANATYKDFWGGRTIFYKGHAKLFCHIMFGMLSMTASTLLSLVQ